jgi:DNA-binding LacI/PurR family transcriptional regulator
MAVLLKRRIAADMAVTLKEVAREAGVNLSTASRSLHAAYGVRTATRARVLAVAERLNYHPNRVARGLVTGRSHMLGLVISDVRNPFFAEVARGAEDAAYAAGYDLVLCNSDLDPAKQLRYIRSLLAMRVDGVLMNSVGDLSRADQEKLAAAGTPIVLLKPSPEDLGFSTVAADNFQGGFLAGQYLARLGHRAIAHLAGPRRHSNLTDRTRGFLKAVQSDPANVSVVVVHGEHSFQGGYEMMKKLLARQRKFTAVFAGNDVIAFGTIRASLEAGLSVPGDLSVVGFDNVEVSSIIHPPLTTVDQPKYELGRAAVEILLKRANVPEHRLLGVELIERQSCRALVSPAAQAGEGR